MEEVRFAESQTKEGAPFAALSYVYFLWIFTFIFLKDNEFARFHAKQGIVIFVGHIVCLSLMFVPVITIIFSFLELVLIAASVYGMFNSLTGKAVKLYGISDLADKLII